MPNSSIWSLDRTLSGASTPGGQSEPGSNDMKGVLQIPQISEDWSLTVRLFSLISRMLIVCGGILLQRCTWCISQSQSNELYDFLYEPEHLPQLLFNKKSIFFDNKITSTLLFLTTYYTIKTDIIKYHLLPKSTAFKLCCQK